MKIVAKKTFREFRLKHGFSIELLGEAAGITYRTSYRIEKGEPARATTAKKMCDALGCGFDDIFQITDD